MIAELLTTLFIMLATVGSSVYLGYIIGHRAGIKKIEGATSYWRSR